MLCPPSDERLSCLSVPDRSVTASDPPCEPDDASSDSLPRSDDSTQNKKQLIIAQVTKPNRSRTANHYWNQHTYHNIIIPKRVLVRYFLFPCCGTYNFSKIKFSRKRVTRSGLFGFLLYELALPCVVWKWVVQQYYPGSISEKL